MTESEWKFYEKCVTSSFQQLFVKKKKREIEREKKSERGKKKGEKLQAEVKITMGSPRRYTATPLCHP